MTDSLSDLTKRVTAIEQWIKDFEKARKRFVEELEKLLEHMKTWKR